MRGRRLFLVAVPAAIGLLLADFKKIGMLIERTFGSSDPRGVFSVTWKCKPKVDSGKRFKSVEQLWKMYSDPGVLHLNEEFKIKGSLLKTESRVLSDGSGLVLHREFASYNDFLRFREKIVSSTKSHSFLSFERV